MVTFEEDIVETYYSIQGYFGIKNIQFSAVEKRPGGKGRGEIDLLTVKPDIKGKIEDAIHVEVSVGVFNFSFVDKHHPGTDEINRLLKKFFENDSDEKIKEYLGKIKCRSVFVCSDFAKNTVDRINGRLKELKVDGYVISEQDKIKIRIKYIGKHKIIELIPFSYMLEDLLRKLEEKKLLTKDFQNQNLAAMQHFIRFKKKWDKEQN